MNNRLPLYHIDQSVEDPINIIKKKIRQALPRIEK